MATSAAATRSRSFVGTTSGRAALYCGSHSGNLESSFIIVSPLALRASLWWTSENGDSRRPACIWCYKVPSPMGARWRCVGRLREYTPTHDPPLDFPMFGQYMEKTGLSPGHAIRTPADLR